MENTLENKAKFFAQYLNQDVLFGYSGVVMKLQFCNLDEFYLSRHESDKDLVRIPCLELKPLSSITDEDAIEVANIRGFSDLFNDKGKANAVRRWFEEMYSIDDSLVIIPDIVDFIRSKGYAFRWNGLSVEELVNRGWIKLKH